MDPGMLHGLTSLRGHPHSWTAGAAVVQLKLMAFDTNGKCSGISLRNILALTYHLFGFVIAFTIILIGTIASRTVFFLTSIKTSLLSWKSNLDIPFAPGSKFGLYMSLWCEEFLDRIGNTPLVKSPPTTIRQLSSPNLFITLPASPHYNPGSSVFISPGKGN